MIAGTIVLETHVLQFIMDDECMVKYTISDAQTGETGTKTVPMKLFSAALGIALDPNGEGEAAQWEKAEAAMIPDSEGLRWIP